MEIPISKEDILLAAQQYVLDHPIKTVAADTAAQYRREFKRIIDNATVMEALERLCNTKKKSTYFKRKYAARHELSRRRLILGFEGLALAAISCRGAIRARPDRAA
jgi:hypothetical protein